MVHNREGVIERAIREFEHLDQLIAALSDEDWNRLVPRPETKEPWTVKDALAHITYWKANLARSIRRQRRPPEERGLKVNDLNHLVYMRWRDRSPQEVLAWHRQAQEDLLSALRSASEDWFSGREHRPEWPYDLDGHSRTHRVKDIELALASRQSG
jgi:hypothetical protein